MRTLFLVGFCFILVSGCSRGEIEKSSEKSPEEAALDRCKDPVNAYVTATEFVSRRLKQPNSADFPWGTRGPGISVTYKGDCTHEIHGYVDAKNSFGAKLRINYYVKIKNELGTERWQLIDIKMIEP